MNTIVTDTPLVNRIANSDLITFDIESLYPKESIILFDLKDFLFHGLILKEKEFREALDMSNYLDKKVIIKGCSDQKLPEQVYPAISMKFLPYVKTLMFGEPCSTVPIYKRK